MTHALQAMTGADADETHQKERLQILLMAAKSKVQAFRDEINENFLNPGQIDKKQIPGIRAVRFIEQYHVASRSEFNSQVGEHLTKAIDSFFSIGGSNKDNKKAVQDGVKSLISGALDAFIGSTAVGESEQHTYIVIPENNAFIRVDIACWKYNFEQTKIIKNSDSAVAYVLCKSVVDHTKLTIDEIIYLTTEALATGAAKLTADEKLTKEANMASLDKPASLELITANLEKMGYDNSLATEISKEIQGTKTLSVAHPLLDKPVKLGYKELREKAISHFLVKKKGDSYFLDVPIDDLDVVQRDMPSLGKVQAYIEEMIAVWKKLKIERRED